MRITHSISTNLMTISNRPSCVVVPRHMLGVPAVKNVHCDENREELYAFENNNGTANLGAKKLVGSQNRRLLFLKVPTYQTTTYISLQVNTAWPVDSVTTWKYKNIQHISYLPGFLLNLTSDEFELKFSELTESSGEGCKLSRAWASQFSSSNRADFYVHQ